MAKRTPKTKHKSSTPEKFTGGTIKGAHPGYQTNKSYSRKTLTAQEKLKQLNKIKVKTGIKNSADLDRNERRRIARLYNKFSDFATSPNSKITIIHSRSKHTLELAKQAGFAIQGKNIFVHKAGAGESVKVGRFMGERVLIRTEYGKTERIFIGGTEVFERVVRKLQTRKLKPSQQITGSFFGISSFRQSFPDVGDFLNYMNNSFVPHMPNDVKPTKRNIAKHKKDLIKFVSIVEIDNPEFEDDDE